MTYISEPSELSHCRSKDLHRKLQYLDDGMTISTALHMVSSRGSLDFPLTALVKLVKPKPAPCPATTTALTGHTEVNSNHHVRPLVRCHAFSDQYRLLFDDCYLRHVGPAARRYKKRRDAGLSQPCGTAPPLVPLSLETQCFLRPPHDMH